MQKGVLQLCKKRVMHPFDRYPSEIPLNLTEEDAAFALAVAEEILNFVEEILLSS